MAISCIGHLLTPATFAQFQICVQLKSQELEVTSCLDGCNFLSSQEQAGGDFQLTGTLYLPKPCSMLDLASLEASSISELVINTTQQQQCNKWPNKDNQKELQ